MGLPSYSMMTPKHLPLTIEPTYTATIPLSPPPPPPIPTPPTTIHLQQSLPPIDIKHDRSFSLSDSVCSPSAISATSSISSNSPKSSFSSYNNDNDTNKD